MSSSNQPSNRLVQETSPYLRQHATNPVDWYPWGPIALQKARELDRPIFLSIGYSACHWCHVMEKESFENPITARILNQHFISIKVDREERPDLDQIYMMAVQRLNQGQGGWPMSVFLTPKLEPFYGGTYYPPEDRYGRPGFPRLLQMLADAWANRRGEIDEVAANLTAFIQAASILERQEGQLDDSLLLKAGRKLGDVFEPRHGGFGSQPKFPHPMDLRLLLRIACRFPDDQAAHMVKHTLNWMAMGGIYDHLGGGFARYSTDSRWLVPHFEKMLYDNSLLISTYLEAYQLTQDPFYREVIEETITWVEREMTASAGPFYSTLDADSEGEEGKFSIWTEKEILEILGEVEGELFNAFYGVESTGNWEHGQNILHRVKTFKQFAQLRCLPEEQVRQRLRKSRDILYDHRSKRIWPGRDEKVLTSWNGLMIGALAQAGSVLGNPGAIQMATQAADFILHHMRTPNGRLLRAWSEGGPAHLNAYLEDYSFLIDGLISLYEATFASRWLEQAIQLTGVMIDQFWDATEGGFFYTGRDHETLIARGKDPQDNAIPSGNSMAVMAFLRLFHFTAKADYRKKAEQTLQLFRGLMDQHPMATGQMLIALDFYLGPVEELVVLGNPGQAATKEVLQLIRSRFRPRYVLAFQSANDSTTQEVVTILEGKTSQGDITTYVCQNFTCQAPLIGLASNKDYFTQSGQSE